MVVSVGMTRESRQQARDRMRRKRDAQARVYPTVCQSPPCTNPLPDRKAEDLSGLRIERARRLYCSSACKQRAWRRRPIL